LTEGLLHQKIKAKKLSKKTEEELLQILADIKKTKPEIPKEWLVEPPKDPLVYANEMNKRYRNWIKSQLGE
jgi:hypothetical protein